MKYNSTISKEEIEKMPIFHYTGNIVVVDNVSDFNNIKNNLFEEKIWGFDTETKPIFNAGDVARKPALLQLSSDKITYLFRLNKIGLQVDLINFLSSPNFLKIGLALRDDLHNLRKYQNFEPAGFIDLQTIAKKNGIEELGLKKLSALILSIRISKRQQLSNWEADILSEKQIKYAAIDSWITREIYLKLQNND
ncbi:MAG: 3'-5' exonuclease domain-containing protein 2 [Bacteroidales bacterium]|jgi:ribonuclease D|nr:3'-5' exonuclease domain-containing protein 2 [Bacteroidales bacterium]